MCCARHRGPRTQSKTADANLDCAFVENALYRPKQSLIGNGQQNRIELATRPGNGRLVVDVGAIADSALVKLVNCHQLSILLGVLGDAHVVDLGEVATGKTTRFVAFGSFFFCSLFLAK